MTLPFTYRQAWRALISLTFISMVSTTGSAQSLTVQSGALTLSITTGIAGGDLTPVVDARSRIRFEHASVPTKITVQTVCPGQKFTLAVEAISVGDGTAAPMVTVTDGMLPMDFITGIAAGGNRKYSTNLQYTASASFSQGNSTELGDDIHTVTYTLVAQ